MTTFYQNGKLVQVTDSNPLPVSGGGGGGGGGSMWHAGTGLPVSDLGSNGDMYLVSSGTGVGDVYTKQLGTWTKVGNIRGSQGPQGLQGAQGPKGDPGEVTQAQFDALEARVTALDGGGG